jgi:uncharacterized membrane protein
MVLELRVPHGSNVDALRAVVPTVLTYVLSFIFLGIYWNNHHHMLHATDRINGKVLWANLHLLFWLSLIPFGTKWMNESGLAPLPTSLYGVVLLLAAFAWLILQTTIIRAHEGESKLATAVGTDRKGKVSAGLYALAIPLAFVHQAIAIALYVAVALMWLIPDRRIEATLSS